MKKSGWRLWRGKEATSRVRGGSRAAVAKTINVVKEAAKQEAPKDESTLIRSGMDIMAPGNVAQGVVCFGGGPGTGHPVVPYAVRWHENSANFQQGRKRFYLRDPVNRLGPRTLREAMRQEIRGRLK